jgi:flagellar assembly factor FliW
MIRIEGTKFGVIEVEPEAVIHLKAGLVGFSSETEFVLVRESDDVPIAYLQSLKSPLVALPVVDAAMFGGAYPVPSAPELAHAAGLDGDGDNLLVLVSVACKQNRAVTGNLLAPIIVDVATKQGVQTVLDPRRWSPFEPIAGLRLLSERPQSPVEP